MVMPVPAYAPQLDDRPAGRAGAGRPGARPGRRAGRDRPRPAGGAVRGRRPHPAAHPAAQPVGPGVHPGRARGHPRRRGRPRRPGDQRRDPRAAGAARRRARVLPVARRHRRARHRAGRREQGLQHRGPQVRADHRARRGAPGRRCSTPRWPRTTPGRPLGVVAAVAAYTHGDPWLAALIERLDQQRTLLGELLAEHLPEARMRPLEGTYLGLARPAGLRPRRPGRRCARTGAGCGWRRATTTTPASTGTSG